MERSAFLNSLVRQIDDIAAIELDSLPAPRVLAIDAPWGHGKSWIANRLTQILKDKENPSKVVLIDAFRFDHHIDAFAVIASTLMAELRPDSKHKRKFLAAAGNVLKSTVPTAIKVASSLGLKAIGLTNDELSETLKDVKEGVVDGSSKLSEKAVEHLFESYSKTQLVQDEFVKVLSEITGAEEKPVVVVIDELDRCRPSFTLEFLEQIKHLFIAENIVFVLFWNARAIHESIRHTYGRETEAEAYLSKFVSLEIPLAMPERPRARNFMRYGSFVQKAVAKNMPPRVDGSYFAECLESLCELLNPSLRDVQKIIRLFVQIKG